MGNRSAEKTTPSARKAKPRGRPVRESYRHGRLKGALVEESLRIMGERSDASFTLREVAQSIGVSHSAAYRHFASKGALLADIAQRGFEMLTAALSQAIEVGKTPEDIVRLQARAYVRTALKHPSHFRCMFGPRQFSEEEGQSVDEAGERAFACLTEAASRLLQRDVESAEGQKAVLAMWSLVHGLAHLAVDQQLCELAGNGSIQRYEEMADGVTGTLLTGLSGRKEK